MFYLRFVIFVTFYSINGLRFPFYGCIVLCRSGGISGGIGLCLYLLSSDEERGRGHTDNAPYRAVRARGRHGLSQAAVQGRRHRFRHTRGILRHPGLWLRGAESLGAFRIPHRRFLQRPRRLHRHEDRHLRLRPYSQRRPPLAQRRPQGGLPQRRRHGSHRGGPRPPGYRTLVHHPQCLHNGSH